MTSFLQSTSFRIGGIFLLISATTFGWISLGQASGIGFWNIGTPIVSAHEDEENEEEDEEEERRDREGDREGDEEERHYVIQKKVPVQKTVPIQDPAPTILTQTTYSSEPCMSGASVAPISFVDAAQKKFDEVGFQSGDTQSLITQFQSLYKEVSQKYPTASGQIEVLQNFISKTEEKLKELRSFPRSENSTILTTKIQYLQALKILANIQIGIIQPPLSQSQNIPCTPSAPTSPIPGVVRNAVTPSPVKPVPNAPKPVITPPVKPVPVVSKPVVQTPKPAPVKPKPVPVAPKPAPVVNTTTRAS